MKRLQFKTEEVIDHTKTGEAMRELRVKAGLSLRDIAERSGLSHSFISDLEKGRRNWTVAHAMAYEKAIGKR